MISPDKLRAARLASGYSLSELARKMRVSPDAVDAYESGTAVPGADELLRAVAWMRVTIDDVTVEARRGSAS